MASNAVINPAPRAKAFTHIVFTIFTLLAISGCGDKELLSEEDKVRATLAAIQTAAEDRSLSGMTNHISPTYRDFEGNDFKKIKSLLQLQLIKNQSINIFSKIRELEVAGEIATVELSVAMASRGVDLSTEANRLRADTHRFSVVLNRQSNEWKVQSVSWQRGW